MLNDPFIPEGEFMLTELVETIKADETVPQAKRATFASAAKLLEKGSGVSMASIAAHPDHVRRHLEKISLAELGVSKKTLSNVKSLLLWGLKHSGIVDGRFYAPKLNSDWEKLWDRLPDQYARSGLSRLFRYASANEIAPSMFDDGVSKEFLEALGSQTLVKKPTTVHQTACRVWNKMVGMVEGWPVQELEVPRYFHSGTLDWDDLPDGYRLDAEKYLNELQNDDPLDLDLPAKPLRPISITKYRYMLRRGASKLLEHGMKEEELTSLAVMVELENVRTILKSLISGKDEKRSVAASEMAGLLGKVAKHWVKCDQQHIETIRGYASRLKPASDGVGRKNQERLSKLRDEKNMAQLLLLPGRLIKELSRVKKPNRKNALLFQKALALLILTSCPLRIRNLAGLDLRRHIKWSGLNLTGSAVINIPAAETKNSQSLSFPLSDQIGEAIRLYVNRFLPLLNNGNQGFLFPGPNPEKAKRPDTVSKQLSALVKDTLGFDINPHLYRHIVHLIVLRQFPGAFEMVSQVLGHKSTQTALSNYGSENIAIALENYAELIADKTKSTAR